MPAPLWTSDPYPEKAAVGETAVYLSPERSSEQMCAPSYVGTAFVMQSPECFSARGSELVFVDSLRTN